MRRLRRLRENSKIRSMLSEHRLLARELVQPLFIKEGIAGPQEIASMPGQVQWTLRTAVEEAKKIEALGIPGVILFGIPKTKDAVASQAFLKSGVIQKAITAIKKACPKLLVISDVCLCEYTSHGHCGIIKVEGRRSKGEGRVKIDNDATLKILAKAALSHARAGADVVAPSDMMDGRVRAIRETLDKNDFKELPILSYAVKYASAFYGPFREAAESAPKFGDRAGYQMNPANFREAIREAETDVAEGADMLLVKPALGYGDILYALKKKFSCPVGAYSVSGEYSMVQAAAARGWLDEKKTALEILLGLKRAGADFIITYWAKDAARWLA